MQFQIFFCLNVKYNLPIFSFSLLIYFRSHYASENHNLIDNSQKLKQVSNAAVFQVTVLATEADSWLLNLFSYWRVNM